MIEAITTIIHAKESSFLRRKHIEEFINSRDLNSFLNSFELGRYLLNGRSELNYLSDIIYTLVNFSNKIERELILSYLEKNDLLGWVVGRKYFDKDWNIKYTSEKNLLLSWLEKMKKIVGEDKIFTYMYEYYFSKKSGISEEAKLLGKINERAFFLLNKLFSHKMIFAFMWLLEFQVKLFQVVMEWYRGNIDLDTLLELVFKTKWK